MIAESRFIAFSIIVTIAARFWWEFRRAEQRRRLVKNVENVLKNEDLARQDEVQFKRAA